MLFAGDKMNPKNIDIYKKKIIPLYDYIVGSNTKQWSLWPNNIAFEIKSQISSLLDDTERLILFYSQSNRWTLFSTDGIIWRDSSSVLSLQNWQIADAGIIAFDNYQSSKSHTYIHVIDIDKKIYHVPMEPGQSCGSACQLLHRLSVFFPHDMVNLNECRALLQEYVAEEKKRWVENWCSCPKD